MSSNNLYKQAIAQIMSTFNVSRVTNDVTSETIVTSDTEHQKIVCSITKGLIKSKRFNDIAVYDYIFNCNVITDNASNFNCEDYINQALLHYYDAIRINNSEYTAFTTVNYDNKRKGYNKPYTVSYASRKHDITFHAIESLNPILYAIDMLWSEIDIRNKQADKQAYLDDLHVTSEYQADINSDDKLAQRIAILNNAILNPIEHVENNDDLKRQKLALSIYANSKGINILSTAIKDKEDKMFDSLTLNRVFVEIVKDRNDFLKHIKLWKTRHDETSATATVNDKKYIVKQLKTLKSIATAYKPLWDIYRKDTVLTAKQYILDKIESLSRINDDDDTTTTTATTTNAMIRTTATATATVNGNGKTLLASVDIIETCRKRSYTAWLLGNDKIKYQNKPILELPKVV